VRAQREDYIRPTAPSPTEPEETEMSDTDEVVVVATIVPKAERRDDVRAALTHAIGRTHAEDDGCLLYALHESDSGFCMIEKWATADALKAHSAGPALAELGPVLRDALTGAPEINVFKAVPAGTEQQGRL
jgi:quinol monooxygenase YgiN